MQYCLQGSEVVEPTVCVGVGLSNVSSANVGSQPIVILRLRELLRRIGLSRSTVYLMLKPGNIYFDPVFASCRIQLTSKSVGFVESKINAWLDSKGNPIH